ncbi:23S rRNA (uridine(2552)-2'-O-)-methyltransferase [Spizellomyces punctatus DAOM BR117]|uniref:23S rRNA (Uridine(2552)-2'-O-)-methyltransferase n=1 Tax=Spizellomyces punctatus (strain DAOM BR117) TaxID=645134 RepID=A0A0L0HNH5_SPIPD|nr:23S rRNA (uridine(2552)-2'-O-)-methyltransferase [Spizellomyces punctatus DAOM BR117]KND02374.1 23S rRNA (uridine(2552)-2'-O-)-methyltransferase [Spizellomyces punctatus DAOM BR117]|eukprot:XP_016610413.1 23S rRNA (uridine(2552)-2'-O-)-methyltransferase [Spizellomyces punctatus DAOM BR117]
MGVKKKYAKGRLDKYYHMAKEQGYRARSAFKLIQLNKKYNFLERSKCLVDLCAAPGGWLQVAAKYMPKPNIIIGLDLAAIKPIPGVITHVEDITTQKCRMTLKRELKTWKADVFLHDGAPNVGTSWLQDAFTQSELVLASLKLATEFLMAGGCFVTKVFRSKDYNKLIWVFNQFFDKVEATKPASSRNVSAEIFVVCREFKAPKKVDPRLLDPKYVFKEVDDVPEEEMDDKKRKERQGAMLNDLFHPEKRRRHRSGYADGDYTLHVASSISDFVRGPDFLGVLTQSNALRFDQDDFGKTLAEHPLTTKELKMCCEDLKVLGKKDFKDLLKWRESIRLDLGLEKKKEERKADTGDKEENGEEDLLESLDAEAKSVAATRKRALRKARERKAKQLIKMRLGMGTPDEIGLEASEAGGMGLGDGHDEGLFRLNGLSTDGVKNAKPIVTDTQKEAVLSSDDEEADEDNEANDDDDETFDTDDEIEQKINNLESEIDGLYEQFRERRLERDPSAKVKKQKEGAQAFEEWYGIEFDKKRKRQVGDVDGDASDDSSDDSEDDSELDEEATGVSGGKKRKAGSEMDNGNVEEEDVNGAIDTGKLSKRAKVFFDNPLFKTLEQPNGKPVKGKESKQKDGLFAQELASTWSDDSSDEDDIPTRRTKSKGRKDDDDENDIEKKGFEVVPLGLDEKDGPNDDFAITTAEAYTLAQRMIRKSDKRDLIDEGFNRYAFNDPDGVPSWFVEEESRHNKPTLPVTKEAVQIIRQRMRALDARPIKKVAEAKFRKQMRTARRLEKMQKKAANVMEDEGGEMTEKAKLTQVSKMMKKAKAKQEKKKVSVVVAKGINRANKGRPKGVKGRYKMVDPRMKKEVRAQKRLAEKGKKKRRKT